jgi:hypothetical protein
MKNQVYQFKPGAKRFLSVISGKEGLFIPDSGQLFFISGNFFHSFIIPSPQNGESLSAVGDR